MHRWGRRRRQQPGEWHVREAGACQRAAAHLTLRRAGGRGWLVGWLVGGRGQKAGPTGVHQLFAHLARQLPPSPPAAAQQGMLACRPLQPQLLVLSSSTAAQRTLPSSSNCITGCVSQKAYFCLASFLLAPPPEVPSCSRSSTLAMLRASCWLLLPLLLPAEGTAAAAALLDDDGADGGPDDGVAASGCCAGLSLDVCLLVSSLAGAMREYSSGRRSTK